MPIDEEGNLELSRQVVSVKSMGRLTIFIKALSACGEISGSVAFIPKSSNVSQESCSIGGCEVEITVAWSLLVESQHVIELKGSADPYEHELNPCTPRMKLEEDAF
ncbi:hypothetical protein TRIUR3_33503 [Triticum urartu]|nr:hypothetical protein TRIUR3_33503 [Triticum urartu]